MRFLYTFIFAIFFSLVIQAQLVNGKNDETVHVSASHLSRLGDELIVSFQVEITRTVSSNQSIEFIPQLQDSLGNFIQLPSIFVNGRKQHIVFQRGKSKREKGSEAIRRENGTRQTIKYLRSIPFSEWMHHSLLSLIEQECGCSVPYSKDSVGLTRLNTLSEIRPQLAFLSPQVEEVKQRQETGRAYLDFPLNEIEINSEYRNNVIELKKIMNSIDLIKNDTNVYISNINIHGYASPEGSYKNNERLARERTRTLKEYVYTKYAFNETLLTTQYTAEDWEGLIQLLGDTAFKEQKELLLIAKSTLEPDVKEQKMRKRYPKFFNFMLEHWLPALRHSDYTIHYVVRPFTLEQAKIVFETQPKNLSIEEMFRIAQTYPTGSPAYNEVFMTAVQMNPEHPVANLNAACIALMQRNTQQADLYLEKALDCPEKTLAIGVSHLLKGEYAEPKVSFQEAATSGLPQATENMEILNKFY